MTAPLAASLGMYDMPWVQDANDALWQAIAARLRAPGLGGAGLGGAELGGVPDRLDRDRPVRALWHDPGLILGQTCGYPLVTALRGIVRLVATPCYDWPGCDGGLYRSMLVVRAKLAGRTLADLRGHRVAVNGPDSNSGMNVLRASVAPWARGQPFFSAVVETGAHLASLAALREGRADLAAIDCVTWGLVARDRPDLLDGIAVIGQTMATPALPFVMALELADPHLPLVRAALQDALADPALGSVRARLGLRSVTALPEGRYQAILALEQAAAELGYPEIV